MRDAMSSNSYKISPSAHMMALAGMVCRQWLNGLAWFALKLKVTKGDMSFLQTELLTEGNCAHLESTMLLPRCLTPLYTQLRSQTSCGHATGVLSATLLLRGWHIHILLASCEAVSWLRCMFVVVKSRGSFLFERIPIQKRCLRAAALSEGPCSSGRVATSALSFALTQQGPLPARSSRSRPPCPPHRAAVKCVSSAGGFVATGGADDQIHIFDAAGDRDLGYLINPVDGAVPCLAFVTPEGSQQPSHFLSGAVTFCTAAVLAQSLSKHVLALT